MSRFTKTRRGAAAGLVLLFLAPGVAGAQSAGHQPGSATVEVTGLDGKLLGGATVVLSGPGGDVRTTSGTGAYSFQGLAAGSYTVRVERRGGKPFPAGEMKIASGETVFYAVNMRAGPVVPEPKAPPPAPPAKDAMKPAPPMKDGIKPAPPVKDATPAPEVIPSPKPAAMPVLAAMPAPATPPPAAAGTPSGQPAPRPAVIPPTPIPTPLPTVAPATAPPVAPPAMASTEPKTPQQTPTYIAAPPSGNPRQLGNAKRTSRISDESVQRLDVEHYPKRPKPILEIGPRFLGNGNLPRGIEMPGGAVWTPQLIGFGTMSSALQGVQNQVTGFRTEEWANRLDLFTNLQLSGTERLLVGFRPLDNDTGASGYNFSKGVVNRTDDRLNRQVRTLFFQGDIGEMFPNLDPTDKGRWDIGFAVGRQPFNFQDGILYNDSVDAVGVTRNTIIPHGGSNLQITGLYGWNGLHGSNNAARANTELFGVVTTADVGKTSLNGEFFLVHDRAGQDDGAYWAVSRTRRFGHLNTTMRLMGSYALHAAVRPTVPIVDTGHLAFAEFSRTPAWTHDLFYVNMFAAFGDFTSVSRAPGTGGPLGRAGILFASSPFGRYPAPVSNRARNTAGGAIGYQKFFDAFGRKQLVFETDGRISRERTQETALAAGARYQQAFGRHFVAQFDAFGKYARFSGKGVGLGLRIESRIEF